MSPLPKAIQKFCTTNHLFIHSILVSRFGKGRTVLRAKSHWYNYLPSRIFGENYHIVSGIVCYCLCHVLINSHFEPYFEHMAQISQSF